MSVNSWDRALGFRVLGLGDSEFTVWGPGLRTGLSISFRELGVGKVKGF